MPSCPSPPSGPPSALASRDPRGTRQRRVDGAPAAGLAGRRPGAPGSGRRARPHRSPRGRRLPDRPPCDLRAVVPWLRGSGRPVGVGRGGARAAGAAGAALRGRGSRTRVAAARLVDQTSSVGEVLERFTGPSLSQHVQDHGALDEFREFAIHRSAYQLKEADPHSWGIPRFSGPGRRRWSRSSPTSTATGVAGETHADLFADVDGIAGPRRRPTAPTSTRSRRHAGDRQPHLDARHPTSTAGGAARAPGGLRDDLRRPHDPLPPRRDPARSGRPRPSVLRGARGGRRPSR